MIRRLGRGARRALGVVMLLGASGPVACGDHARIVLDDDAAPRGGLGSSSASGESGEGDSAEAGLAGAPTADPSTPMGGSAAGASGGSASGGGTSGGGTSGGGTSGGGTAGSTAANGGTDGEVRPDEMAPRDSANAGGAPVGGASADDPSALEPLDSGWVFDPTVVRTYELSLDADAWQALQNNAVDEEYAPASLSVDGVSLEQVGLRFKGSLGTLVSCFDDSGARTCDKLSMKLKFSEYLRDQRFDGLRRLTFNSMAMDDSQLRERLAYHVFREMGIVAPRASHARLVVNGEDQGLFSLVESIDGTFTDDHFRGGDGNLYKEIWPDVGDPAVLTEYLKTNEETADHSVLLQFHAELMAASDAELPATLARYMDLDGLFAHVAVAEAIRDWDGFGAFYCGEEGCENHNYYLYQHEREPRFTLIPWDFDNTFWVETPLDGIPGFFDEPGDCGDRYQAVGREVRAPGCDPLFRALSLDARPRYVAQLDRLLAGPFVLETLQGLVADWQAQIEPIVATDAAGPGLDGFREAVLELSGELEGLRDRLVAHRADQAALVR